MLVTSNTFLKGILGFIVLGVLVHVPTITQAQSDCSGHTCTVTISTSRSTNYTVENGQTYCFTGGTYTGSLTTRAGATVCIGENATFSPSSLSDGNSTTTIYNYGTWNTSITNLNLKFTLNNYGSFYNDGNVSADAPVNNYGDFESTGDLLLNGSADFSSDGSSLTIGGHFRIDSDVSINGNATIGDLTVNSGTLNLVDGELKVTGDFFNGGTVTSTGSSTCGQITVLGSSQNQGTFGDGSTSLDICDSTSAGGSNSFDLITGGTVDLSTTNCACSALLPLDLVAFNYSNNQLTWQTAWEENTSHFEIQRSLTGEHFESIDRIAAAGESQALLTYHYSLEYLNINSYYRLKMVDLDGSFTYSRIIEAMISNDNTPLFQINSDNQLLSFQYPDGTTLPLHIDMYHIGGRLVKSVDMLVEDEESVELLPPGLYLVRYQNAQQQGVWRYLKQ